MDISSLAAVASNTLVAAAVTDAWETARHGFARLLGRGDSDRTEVAERRLDETCDQLTAASGADLEQVQAVLTTRWAARLADMLEEHPDAGADLRALVEDVQAAMPAGLVSAADHSAGAGRDMTITATGGSTAAGVIHGNVAPPNPPGPGPVIT